MEDIFERAVEEARPKTNVDRVIETIESEFRETTSGEREKHKAKVLEDLAVLKKKLNACKNVKNHKATEVNLKQSETRKKLREQIEVVKDELERIKIEEEGSGMTVEKLMAKTKMPFKEG